MLSRFASDVHGLLCLVYALLLNFVVNLIYTLLLNLVMNLIYTLFKESYSPRKCVCRKVMHYPRTGTRFKLPLEEWVTETQRER